MTVAEVILKGGKLWLDDALVMRFSGPDELIPIVREHKPELRMSLMVAEWRRECLRLAHGSDFAAQWRTLAELPKRQAAGIPEAEIHNALIVNWKLARKDLIPLTGSELVGMVHRTFHTKEIAK
jgi:hypothetical protein